MNAVTSLKDPPSMLETVGPKIFSVIFKIWFILSFVYLHIICAIALYTLCSDDRRYWQEMDYLFFWNYVHLLITFDIVIWQRTSVKSIFSQLKQSFKSLAESDQKAIKRRFNFYLTLTTVYILVAVVIESGVSAYYIQNPHKVKNSNQTVIPSLCLLCRKIHVRWVESMVAFYRCMYRLIVIGSWTVFPIIYYLMYVVLLQLLLDFKKNIQSNRVINNVAGLVSLQRWYGQIHKIIDSFNCTFSNLVLFWYGTAMIIACRGMTNIMINLDKSLWAIMYFSHTNLHAMFVVVSLSMAAARLPECCEEALEMIQRLNYANRHDSSAEYYSEMSLLIQQIYRQPLAVTAGKCLTVDRRFFFSFVSVVITFVIICIQLNPSAMKTIQNIST